MKTIKYIILINILISLTQINIFPCTLWGAIGNSTKDNTCLIAKNYDWAPDHKVVLKKISASKNSYAYFGIYAEHKNPRFSAGINQKGLIVVTASASSIPSKTRKKIKDKKNLLISILARYANIPSIVKNKNIFIDSRPMFYLIADKETIIQIEVAPDGKYSIKSEKNGVLFHTNHYIDEKLFYANIKTSKSSLTRYERIKKLLKDNSKFTFDDFVKYSNDRNDGPDNSIFRTGSNVKSQRTLATWIIALSEEKSPVVYIKLINPEQKPKEFTFQINNDFWKKALIN